jgi:cytochrome c-type biogenesis protein CcmH/NrfG
MEGTEITPSSSASHWPPRQVYLLAVVCLIIGLPIGYLFRGSAGTQASAQVGASPTAGAPAAGGQPGMPSLDDMKRMADKQAEPLLQQLKSNPNDAVALAKAGDIYQATHQFQDAADYYRRSLAADPANIKVRSRLATCLYYTGKIDDAIAQLQQSLTYDPKHAGTLFNLGVIQWKGKGDGPAAIATWQKLLQLYPTLPADLPSKDKIENLIAEARLHPDGGAAARQNQ